jgi:hypothetical protein
MKGFATRGAVLAAVVLLAGSVLAATPTVKDIMGKAHKGPNSLLANIGKDLKADEPDWDDIQKETKELVELGTSLGKNDPPQGDKDSWDKLTKSYLEGVKTLDSAAQKKDQKGAQSAQAKLAQPKTCMDCHQVHKKK